MAIPKYEAMLRPILELASKQDVTRKIASAAMVAEFKLSTAEQAERLTSGGLVYVNRSGWAMTFLTKAKFIEKVAKASYRATKDGVAYLKDHPLEITHGDLKQVPG